MIDTATKTYGEYDSFCRDRSSPYVFQLLTTMFSEVGIHLQSFRRLATDERMQIPSQGLNYTDCGVYLLCFMSCFASGKYDVKE